MFKKKPVLIEARKFETNNDDGSHLDGLVEWITANGGNASHNGTDLAIRMSGGDMAIAECFDWVVKSTYGEFFPCKPEIFEMMYEEA